MIKKFIEDNDFRSDMLTLLITIGIFILYAFCDLSESIVSNITKFSIVFISVENVSKKALEKFGIKGIEVKKDK
jgi:hypothetical protein